MSLRACNGSKKSPKTHCTFALPKKNLRKRIAQLLWHKKISGKRLHVCIGLKKSLKCHYVRAMAQKIFLRDETCVRRFYKHMNPSGSGPLYFKFMTPKVGQMLIAPIRNLEIEPQSGS
ncbi:hypothetical protein DDZ16_01115 [Marinilabilia rubra]|uniref:Uncharacterized protein n=1 Tax=Marinilabilia rubra TaxID=2162893 RepID=A0A2U2BDI0_9BACT|nr:hypothetical protein DDZ16_01115 [Marinilabilia rubra]